jgi:maltooligosyltrehalose trehalohydrolase
MIKVGAHYVAEKQECEFTVWAPLSQSVVLKIVAPHQKLMPMEQILSGYWQITTQIRSGDRYVYQLDGCVERPDPASQHQPDGVHDSSEIVDHTKFVWTDREWTGIALADFILYEVHVGTFTQAGTFDAILPRLARLKELGITALEIMPVAQFPGDRNWGYDGVYPYAVQHSYGGPEGLKRLVNACHEAGISVVLDVVYNHLGPEGNYLTDFAPYLTQKFNCLWGEALNFDDAYSDGVRNYFIQNALYWLETFHIDALRLDAIQGIYDLGARHFLEELVDRVEMLSQRLGRKLYVTAESDLNDVRIIRPKAVGGFGIDAQWCDDFHHALHTLLTGESQDYYQDFGRCKDLEKSYREGFVYSGQYAPARKRSHGNSSAAEPAHQFIVCAQNHDQVGNRLFGDRLAQLISFEALKLAAGSVLLSPYLPLLFMGEEYGEDSPFFYFISHSDPELIQAVRTSKEAEFKTAGFNGESYHPDEVTIFSKSKVKWEQQYGGQHAVLWKFYQHLIFLRRTHSVLKILDKNCLNVWSREIEKLIFIHRTSQDKQILYVLNFNTQPVTYKVELPSGLWQKILDSADLCWSGPGAMLPQTLSLTASVTIAPSSFALYEA